MALKNIKQDLYHWIGVDLATKPDITVVTQPCGNCGTYRVITGVIVEKCPNCGDDEIDLSEPTIYDQEGTHGQKDNAIDKNSKIQKISPPVLRGHAETGDEEE